MKSSLQRWGLLAGAALFGIAPSVQAQSLVDLYTLARGYDATFLSAKKQFDANVAKADQAVAGLLPQIAWSATVMRSNSSMQSAPAAAVPAGTTFPFARAYGQRQYGLSLTQPLYRPGNLATYQQGQKQLLIADAQLQAAGQDLMVRVSQAYFDVLAAQDSLVFIQAQKKAVAEQLASAKRNFEVGTATITDTREAQARFDLMTAQEIAAQNDLNVKQLALDVVVGKSGAKPLSLNSTLTLPTLSPQELFTWSDQANKGYAEHPSVRSAQIALDVAKLESDKAVAGHKPTLDASLGVVNTTNLDGTSLGFSNVGSSRAVTGTASLVLSVPLYMGGLTQNTVREKLALEGKAAADLENVKRGVMQASRTAFLGLQSGFGMVRAYEAAEASSQSALDANKLGYQVGVRINIDVLNAQSQLYQTKRDLAKARYDVLMGHLKLRQANGNLAAKDLTPINALLQQQ